MRILIYDNSPANLDNFCNMIKLYPIEIILDKVSDFNDAIYMFKKHLYDKIFIDFNDDIGKKIANEIIEQKPTQKLYLLNEHFECLSKNKNCKDCVQNFSKGIVIKPLMQSQLTKILSKKFICESFQLSAKEFKLEKIKKEVHKKYPYLKFDYDKDRDTFMSDNIPTNALVYVTGLLNKFDIRYNISHKNQIIIT